MDWIHKSSTPCLDSVPANAPPLQRQDRLLVCHSSPADVDMDLREVYFLILHFLSNGPCDRTFGPLRDEILEKGLLPRRYHSSWSRSGTFTAPADDAISLPLTYDNLVERFLLLLLLPCLFQMSSCNVTCVWSIRILLAQLFSPSITSCLFSGQVSSYWKGSLGEASQTTHFKPTFSFTPETWRTYSYCCWCSYAIGIWLLFTCPS